MRKFIISTILILLIPAFAYSQVDGSSQADKPLKIYDAQKTENKTQQAELIKDYSQSGFDSCFVCPNYDLTNPFSYSACLRLVGACLSGEEFNDSSCPAGMIRSSGECVSYGEGCRVEYGEHSYATGRVDIAGKVICECSEGYSWNGLRTKCVASCPDNMIYYSAYKQASGEFLYGRCQSLKTACQSEYGDYSEFSRRDDLENYFCRCQKGYIWEGEKCVEGVIVLGIESGEFVPDAYEATVFAEKVLVIQTDNQLADRLSGMILLQVENNGEAWYINPDDSRKYFLSSPVRAFKAMRTLGMGATHEFLTSYTTYPDYVAGKILIDVDDYGKAYYIYPGDKHAYYLGKPADALAVMRELGLGVTNENIRRILVGELE